MNDFKLLLKKAVATLITAALLLSGPAAPAWARIIAGTSPTTAAGASSIAAGAGIAAGIAGNSLRKKQTYELGIASLQ